MYNIRAAVKFCIKGVMHEEGIVFLAFLALGVLMFAACGGSGGSSGGGIKAGKLANGLFLTFTYEVVTDTTTFENYIVVHPKVYDSNGVIQNDYDTGIAAWTVSPVTAGSFYPYEPPGVNLETDSMYKGSKRFEWDKSASKANFKIDIGGVTYEQSLNIKKVLGISEGGGDYEFQAVRILYSSQYATNYTLNIGEGTSLEPDEVLTMKARIRTTSGDFIENKPTTWSLSRTDVATLSADSGSTVTLTCHNNSDDVEGSYFYTKVILTVTCDGHTESFRLNIDTSYVW